MSNDKKNEHPALPESVRVPLDAAYTHPNGGSVHYHYNGGAYNAQRRYVGKAIAAKPAPSAVAEPETPAPAKAK